MTQQEFQQFASTIPNEPGIYKYFDQKKELLYVGKAKNLRKRVGSYFNKTFSTYKTYELVQRIHHMEFTVVNSEQDAFLLENSLIKQFQPKFNISLKDDKSYPYIVIKNEPFPRVFLTRRKYNDGSQYLGPFTSVAKVRELLYFIKANVQLRTCKLNLTDNNIRKGKFKVCLEYHLGNCKGPCEGKQSREDYEEGLTRLRNLLRGNLGPVISGFRKEMKDAAERLAFERAEELRKKIEHLETYQSRSVIVNDRILRADVFSMVREGDKAFVNFLMVENGTIVQTHSTQLETHLEETEAEILAFAVAQIRDAFDSRATEIIVAIPIEFPQSEVEITVPRAGDKKKLLELSEKNTLAFKDELEKKKALYLTGNPEESPERILEELMEDLQLSSLPVHIECFDNSNFQGSFPVSAMVCFKNGVESKKDYRHFNVRTVKGINDFATMKEAVHRRYKRLKEAAEALPQLVIIDGGKGQLHAALEAIHELELDGSMTLVGLAKNEEELFFSGDQESLKLPFDGRSLRFIRRIRDEVHRFGIGFHRLKRSKGTFKNQLEEIDGIGKATSDRLLSAFRSVKKIRELSIEELSELVGEAKARIIWNFFENENRQAEEKR
ncbi:MAG: excinuclease ABC subunit UvrC [Chitinophagales bacterium]